MPVPEVASRMPTRSDSEAAERTDLKLGPEFDNDRFANVSSEREPETNGYEPDRTRAQAGGKWRPVRSALPALK